MVRRTERNRGLRGGAGASHPCIPGRGTPPQKRGGASPAASGFASAAGAWVREETWPASNPAGVRRSRRGQIHGQKTARSLCRRLRRCGSAPLALPGQKCVMGVKDASGAAFAVGLWKTMNPFPTVPSLTPILPTKASEGLWGGRTGNGKCKSWCPDLDTVPEYLRSLGHCSWTPVAPACTLGLSP